MVGAGVQKRSCETSNYVLKVTLHPDEIKNPSITRTLSCPAFASFQMLHQALQISFGWTSTHLFEFKLKPPGSRLVHSFDFSSQPARDLLRIVDEKEEDSDEGLDFQTTKPIKASTISIGNVLSNERYRGAVLQYDYDFGDGWQHEIVVVGQEAATDVFICVAGEGHGAAEDVGGFTGWEELQGAYNAAMPTEEQKNLKHWYENKASNRDPQGLAGGRERVWDQAGVNLALGRLRC